MIEKNLIFFMPHMVGGGVEKNLYIVSNYCAKKIRNVYLISSTKNFNKNFKNVRIINPKLKSFDFLSPKINYFICLFVLFKLLIKNKNSLVFSFQANIYCITLCKMMGIKIIARSNSSPSGWSKGFIKSFFFRKILKLADSTIVNSLEFKKELYDKFNVKTVCIYNPLDKKKIVSLSKKKKGNIFFKDSRSLKIINIARFTSQKDHLTLLKAVNYLKKVLKIKLIIVGRGSCENKMRNFIYRNNLEKIVKIYGYTQNPYPYLKQSDLFILSSRFEGLPNVLLESLVLEKFVISSNCPTGPKEILLGNKGGLLFRPGDYKDLAKKIMFFYKNKKICKKKLSVAIKNLDRFDYNKNIQKYFKLVSDKLQN